MKKILVLDDNEDYLEILELVLGKKYITRCSAEVKAIEQLIAEFEPDLMLVDYYLGTHTSSTILNALRSSTTGRAIPFILLSGVHEIEKKAAELGAAGYISKPSSLDHIRKCIDDFFKYRQS